MNVMEVKFNLPEEIARKLQTMDNADTFAAEAIEGRFEVLEWQRKRYGKETHEIVDRALKIAEETKEKGLNREEMFAQLRKVSESQTAVGEC